MPVPIQRSFVGIHMFTSMGLLPENEVFITKFYFGGKAWGVDMFIWCVSLRSTLCSHAGFA
jgi:hypothetical protein